MTLPRWAREPLVHFLVAGALIYGFFAWRGDLVDPDSRVIALDRALQAQIAENFRRTIGRPPTDAELDAAIEQYVREEVLYREALRLGLDAGDPVVRRRMATKMDELAAASAETAAVSDAQLKDWLDAHRERFADGGTVSFDQAWFASGQGARAALAAGQVQGDPISLPRSVEAMPLSEMRAVFGGEFAAGVGQLAPVQAWQGPIRSGLGWHLVRLRARTAGTVPPLAAIRQQVEADWRNRTIAERRERAYRQLRDAYQVRR